MNIDKNIVAVAMSGGVDSSVAAALLKDSGYQVIGLTMHLWSYGEVGGNIFNETSCCSLETMNDARTVCQSIGIPHYVIDVRDDFKKFIISDFIAEYLKGRTPNPCVLCNSIMKWSILYKKAVQLGAYFIATGHYAQVKFDNETQRYLLEKGTDQSKDQSYALWGLTQDQLKHTKLPLGKYSKTQVRLFAEKFQLKTWHKKESQDICFITDNDYGRFLKEQVPDLQSSFQKGEIVDIEGKVLGYHRGYPYFTVGQRKKLGIAVGKPLYVIDVDPQNNRIVVGDKEDLNCEGLVATNINWISIEPPHEEMDVIAKIRYNDDGKDARIFPESDGEVFVKFKTSHQAVTPGQSVVFYRGNVVVGGGIIDRRIAID